MNNFFSLDVETKNYFKAVLYKLSENLLSVKVWFFLLPFIISCGYTYILIKFQFDYILEYSKKIIEDPTKYEFVVALFTNLKEVFTSWLTFNVTLVGTVIVVKEVFEIPKLKLYNLTQTANTLNSSTDQPSINDDSSSTD